MTAIHSQTSLKNAGGGRISSPQYRRSHELCEGFEGLEEGASRYDLLRLVKRTGKYAGFTSRMIELLDYYIAFTRDMDWEEGSRAIVYQSQSKTALDLGVSERQIQKLEKQLFEIGAITWHDSGNHRRYGQRCNKTGRIIYAFGVDITPLAYLKPHLQAKLHEKQLYDQAWMETKRQISWYRRQIRAIIAEMEEQGACTIDAELSYNAISGAIRTYMDLSVLRDLLDQHKALYGDLCAKQTQQNDKVSDNSSCKDDLEFVHYNSTNNKPFDKSNTRMHQDKPGANIFQERRNERSHSHRKPRAQVTLPDKGIKTDSEGKEDLILSTGLQHITIKQVLNTASYAFKAHIPMHDRAMTWHDFVEAGFKRKSELGISQSAWGDACSLLTRNGAAICVLLTDQASQRAIDPVRKPAAYFNGMLNKARTGELHLHKSIFGILKAEQGGDLI